MPAVSSTVLLARVIKYAYAGFVPFVLIMTAGFYNTPWRKHRGAAAKAVGFELGRLG